MKIRLLIFSSLIIVSQQAVAERTYAQTQPDQECECYCSVLCGPRPMKSDDAPFYDDEHGQCFCKERDYQLYVKNGCSVKKNEKFESCCDMSAKKKKKKTVKKVSSKKASMY